MLDRIVQGEFAHARDKFYQPHAVQQLANGNILLVDDGNTRANCSMSTGDGAILAMSTVFAHNLLRKLPIPFFKDDKNLLIVARLATIVWAPIAAAVASARPAADSGAKAPRRRRAARWGCGRRVWGEVPTGI